ncbi:fluoride efflux transporter CrcB [Legionella feeleii]|uniref:Fluoride-specific ion channel FluC n=1 Tax=Legionella feeleii TaxID=453 RepID=A0A0W0TLC2_9GAMM|nr:fluoride efflux transporter CrcB [Legionella feeleii]KTC96402.1 camphor resistance protein CrcB [Legionella feeleii]SPX61833.1 camphor resistance [Legionella feeleii]
MLASVLAVACGGTLGAVARFATVSIMQHALGSRYPYGTWVVNSLGSFLAGFLIILLTERFAVGDYWRLVLVVGFLGAYTTFSSFAWETWILYQNGQVLAAVLNILFNNVGSLAMVLLGIYCGRLLS